MPLLAITLFTASITCSIATDTPQLPADDASPEEVVDALENALLMVMQIDDSDTISRAVMLKPVLARTFNFQRMSRFIFGTNWAALSPADQDKFITAFLHLSCASYAQNFDHFNNEYFDPVDNKSSGDDRAHIRHKLVTSKQTVEFDYALTKTADGWKIANIIAKGVSDLALKRTQYSKLYSQGGLDAVLEYMEDQTRRLYAS